MPGADLLQWKCTYSGHYLFIGFPCYQFRVFKYARINRYINSTMIQDLHKICDHLDNNLVFHVGNQEP